MQLTEAETTSLSESIQRMSAATEQLSKMADLSEATSRYLEQMAGISEQMERLNKTTTALNEVSQTLLQSYKAITDNSEGIKDSSTGYVEQMQSLSHNIAGLNTIYEIQLKGVSSQLDSIDRVNRGLKDIRDMYEKSAANWVMGEVSANVNQTEGMTFAKAPVTPELLAAVLGRVIDGTVNQKGAKQIFAAIWAGEVFRR